MPRPGERVLLMPFVLRGMSLPLHDFFCGLLFFYVSELHHIMPNRIYHIVCFIAMCECFLGTQPHFDMWRKYFRVKAQKNGNDVYDYGGADIQLRPNTNYFKLGLSDFVKR